MAFGNASGDLCRPLVLFKGVRVLTEWLRGLDNKVTVTANTSGTMDPIIFRKYVIEEVIPFVDKLSLPISEMKVF